MASLQSKSLEACARLAMKTYAAWPIDVIASADETRTRRRSEPDTALSADTCAARWLSGSERRNKPRSSSVKASPIAIGAGRAAVGFLRLHKEVAKHSSDMGGSPPSLPKCEKDIVAPSTPASDRPCHARLRRTELIVLLNIKEESVRCSCCNKEEYWVCLDVFNAMDRHNDGAVKRDDFFWALHAHGATVEFQRVIKKARLSDYFKSTACALSLEEFIQRMFPNASPSDTQKMQRWTCLRKANRKFASEDFKGKDEELREIFALLAEDPGCGIVTLADMLRAEILTKAEATHVISQHGQRMSFKEFNEALGQALVRRRSLEAGRSKGGSDVDDDCESKVRLEQNIAKKLQSIRQAHVLDGMMMKSSKPGALLRTLTKASTSLYQAPTAASEY